MTYRRAISVLVTLLIAYAPAIAGAQPSGQASLLVTVVDEQGAVVTGAEVTVIDPARGTKVVATTTPLGSARVLQLPPGSYDVMVTQGTLKAATSVLLRAGVDAALQMTLRPATYVETVNVDAAPVNLLDTRSAGQSVTLDSKDALEIPVAGNRSWFNLLNMVPGTTVLSFPASARSPYFFYHHGSGESQHVTVIDGADVSSASASLPSNVQLPTALVNQMDAKVSGIDAASPLGWGLNIAIETRTGTNRVAGSIVSSFQSANWFDTNTPGGATTASDSTLADITVGGPILRNRAWFLSSERIGRSDGETGLSALEYSTLQALLGQVPSRPRGFDNDTWFNKATFAWHDSAQQLFVSHQYDSLREKTANADFGVTNELGGHIVNTRYSHVLRSSVLLRGNVAFNTRSLKDYPDRPDVPRRPIFSSVLDSSGRLTGVTQLTTFGSSRPEGTTTPETKVTGSLDLTASFRARGVHELKAGLFLDRHTREQFRQYNAGGRAIEELVLIDPARPQLGFVPFHLRVYENDSATLGDEVGRDLAFYVQNKWSATSRLTMSGGIRVDLINNRDVMFNIQTQRSTEVGPNLGAAFALTPVTVVRGYYGRRFSALSETATRLGSSAIGFTDFYDRDRNGSYETQFFTPASSSTRRDIVIDLDQWHQPYVDEFSAAVERQILKPLTVSAIYLRRLYEDATILLDRNAMYDGMRFVGYRDESLNAIYQLTNNKWSHNVYDELSFTSRLSIARVHALASYTRQWRCTAGTWYPNDPASFLQPDTFRNCKGIGVNQGSTTTLRDYDSLSGTSMTGGIQWRDHIANVSTTVELPFGVQAALEYRYQSGMWSGPIVTRVAAPDPRVGAPTVTLSTGRVVSNPLATLIRFAGRDRSVGQFHLPAMQEINLAIRKRIVFGRWSAQTGVEIYNLANGDSDLQLGNGANQLYSTSYGLSGNRQLPRSALVRLDVSF
jgi:hypothetical protein